MSAYFASLVTLPVIVDEPGQYITRGGDLVVIDNVSAKHDLKCTGRYLDCGTPEGWHKSGRILATSQTSNDIVSRCDSLTVKRAAETPNHDGAN